MEKTVAILGAGPSGLVSAKEAIENGFVPTLFEKEEALGGVWNVNTGAVWDTMHTNISRFTTCFGDTMYSDDTEMFPSSSSVFQYLNDYADKWELRRLIKFRATVVKVETFGRDAFGSSGWSVTWRTVSGDLESKNFAALIVATGIFATPSIPNIPGLESFPGKIIHSKDYKSGGEFEGLKVLTVGGSFSGVEIAADVTNHAKESYHTFLRPFWIIRRYLLKMGNKIPVDLLFYNRKFYSEPLDPWATEESICIKKNNGLMDLCKEQQSVPLLKISESDFSTPINSVISDNYISQVEKGKLIPMAGKIKRIEGNNIIFEGDKMIENIDSIIFGTGFQPNTSFFSRRILEVLKYTPSDRLQPLILFQECVHPELKNLFFIGMYKGPYFAVMEQQARWACRLLSGKVHLPSREEIQKGLEKELDIRRKIPRPQFPHPEYVLFADTIAKYAQSFPDLEKLMKEQYTLAEALDTGTISAPTNNGNDARFIFLLNANKEDVVKKFMLDPVTPSHYNLVDNPRQALEAMDFMGHFLNQLNS